MHPCRDEGASGEGLPRSTCKHGKNLLDFQEAAGPTMDEEHGDGIWLGRATVYEVEVDPIHWQHVLRNLIDLVLDPSPGEISLPVLCQALRQSLVMRNPTRGLSTRHSFAKAKRLRGTHALNERVYQGGAERMAQ